MLKKKAKKGFTIVELVIVIAVIAILAAVLIPTFTGVVQDAKDNSAKLDAKNVYTQYVVEQTEANADPEQNVIVECNGYYFEVVNGVLNTDAISDPTKSATYYTIYTSGKAVIYSNSEKAAAAAAAAAALKVFTDAKSNLSITDTTTKYVVKYDNKYYNITYTVTDGENSSKVVTGTAATLATESYVEGTSSNLQQVTYKDNDNKDVSIANLYKVVSGS